MKNAAVIVAAGRGARIGDDGGPKQYRWLEDRSVLQHTIDCFTEHSDIDFVQVVIHPDDAELYAACVRSHPKLQSPINGGASRQASCKAGIDALFDLKPFRVLIHDGARPFVNGKQEKIASLSAMCFSVW